MHTRLLYTQIVADTNIHVCMHICISKKNVPTLFRASYAYRFCNEPRCRYTTDIERYYDINNSEVYKLLTDFTSTVQARNSGSQDADSKLALFAKYYGSIGVQDLEEFYRITSHNRHHMIRG